MTDGKRIVLTLALLTLLSGCAGVDLVTAGQPSDLGDGISVTPTTAWARIRTVNSEPILTIDGIGLGEVRYFTGVKPGDPIFKVQGYTGAQIGAYSATMLPNDVIELFVANLTKAGGQDVQTSGLRPAKFGSVDGFRFDVTFVSRDGLNMRGEVLAAQRGGKLDMLVYTAPDEYYFARRQPDVEQLFMTIKLTG